MTEQAMIRRRRWSLRSGVALMFFMSMAMQNAPRDGTPRFLVLARERVRPGSEAAYHKNEVELATICATLRCPHPYVALATEGPPLEVWWINAFASREERDGLADAYRSNRALTAALQPLAKRKEAFRETFTSTAAEDRRDAIASGPGLSLIGARFVAIRHGRVEAPAAGVGFETDDGDLFQIVAAPSRDAVARLASRMGAGTLILAVKPEWSFPAASWVNADPDFWRSSPAAGRR